MDLNRTLELAGILVESENRESDAELKKMWNGFDAETKSAFGDSLKGFMAYRRGEYSKFFKDYKPTEKK